MIQSPTTEGQDRKPTLGKALRDIRERLGISQTDLAMELGAPGRQSDVSKWERDKALPPERHLERIAHLGGVDAEWLKGLPALGNVMGYLAASRNLEGGDQGSGERLRPAGVPAGDELRRRLHAIVDEPLPTGEKSELLVDLALVLRAAALHERSEAARREARTAELEAEAALERQRDLARVRRFGGQIVNPSEVAQEK